MTTKSICFAGLSKGEEAEITTQFRQANAQLGNAWTMAPEAEAAVVVIDMDSMYGQMSLMKALGAGKVVVALTSGSRADTDFLLQRPASAEALQGVLAAIAARAPAAPPAPEAEPAPAAAAADLAPVAVAPAPIAAPTPTPAPAPTPTPAPSSAPAPSPSPAPTPMPAPAASSAATEARLFDLLRPGGLAGPVRLQLPDAPDLVLDPASQQYFGGAALKPLLPYCSAVLPAPAPVPAEQLAGLSGGQPLARLAWLCALASGHGALLPGFGPNDKYKLLKWPQTEREFPKHFRIATVMMKGPALLTEIAEQSGASLAEVIDFVNASLVSGVAVPEGAAAIDVEANKGGGLLARFRR